MKRGAYQRKVPKQAVLPGTQSRKDASLDASARAYLALMAQHLALKKRVDDAADTLLARLEQTGKPLYTCDGVTVVKVDGKPKVRVQLARDLGDDTEAAEALESVGVVVD